MIWTIIFVALLAIGIILWLKAKKEPVVMTGLYGTCFSAFILLTFVIKFFIIIPETERDFARNYDNTTLLINDFVRSDSTEACAFAGLSDHVLEINNDIDDNAQLCDSKWRGWFFSREIAEYPKLSLAYETDTVVLEQNDADPD